MTEVWLLRCDPSCSDMPLPLEGKCSFMLGSVPLEHELPTRVPKLHF